jgi:hypothetical protein
VSGAIALQSTICVWRPLARRASAASRAKSSAAPRIQDRKHDIAFGNESRNRTDIDQSRLARERTGALAAVLQRGINIQALRFDLYRYRLAHISGASLSRVNSIRFI